MKKIAKNETDDAILNLYKTGESIKAKKLGGVLFELLHKTEDFEVIRTTIEPGGGISDSRHDGEEHHRVIEGELDVIIGADIMKLKRGETVSHYSGVMHSWKNNTDENVVILTVSKPPTFM